MRALRCACRHGIRQKNEIACGLVFSFGCVWAWKTKKPLRMQRLFMYLVPRRGLEPPRCYSLVPETSASTNSATWAFRSALNYRMFFWGIRRTCSFFRKFCTTVQARWLACPGRHKLPHGPTAVPGLARQGWMFSCVHDAPENKKAAVCAAASIF